MTSGTKTLGSLLAAAFFVSVPLASLADEAKVALVPGGLQNFVEWAWESLDNWAISLGGEESRRHVPLFAAFFLFVLFSNWSGLLPIFGKVEALRAPTSDVNVTVALEASSFAGTFATPWSAARSKGDAGPPPPPENP